MSEKLQKILRALVVVILGVCAVLLSNWAVAIEKADVNLVMSSGQTSAIARVSKLETFRNGVKQSSFQTHVDQIGGKLGDTGTATFRNNVLSINKMAQGDKIDLVVDFSNYSSANVRYRLVFECKNDLYGLYRGLKISVRSSVMQKTEHQCSYDKDLPLDVVTDWAELSSGKTQDKIFVSLTLPSDQYNGYGTQISLAVQVIE